MITIQKYAQHNPRWGGLVLGKSGLTVAGYGCTSCVSASALGVDPINFVSRMNTDGGYTDGGLLRWNVASTLFGGDWERQLFSDKPADLNYIKGLIRQGFPVLLETRFPGNYNDNERHLASHMHWVIALDEELTIYDPWYDRTEPFSTTYGDPVRWIYSAHCFKKKLEVPQDDYIKQLEADRLKFWAERDEARKQVQEYSIALDAEKAKSKSFEDFRDSLANTLNVPAKQEEIQKAVAECISYEDSLSKANRELLEVNGLLNQERARTSDLTTTVTSLTEESKSLHSELQKATDHNTALEKEYQDLLASIGSPLAKLNLFNLLILVFKRG